MKPLISLAILLVVISKASARNCDTLKFKKLESISRKVVVTVIDFKSALLLVENLELNKCADYIKERHKKEYVEASLTSLFGEVCLKNNSYYSTNEYVKYAKRNSGSAEEEISFKLEQLFVRQPEYVLSSIGNDKSLFDQLEWGFVNNHYYDKNDQSESRVKTSLHRKPQLL